MNYRILPLLLLVFVACKQEPQGNNDDLTVSSLEAQLESLNRENQRKDSMISEALRFYQEIERNLESIDVRQRNLSESNSEGSQFADKEWIINEIKQINHLREQNQRKVKQLQKDLKSSGVEVAELQELIRKLMEDVQSRDEQLAVVKEELERSNAELARLFDAYQEQEFDLQVAQEDANRVFYVYGTEKELVDNGVLDKKNGFIGIGKKIEMREDLNLDYLSEIDVRDTDNIQITGKNPKIMTTHPANAYHWEGQNLVIDQPTSFWKLSKVLVVVVK